MGSNTIVSRESILEISRGVEYLRKFQKLSKAFAAGDLEIPLHATQSRPNSLVGDQSLPSLATSTLYQAMEEAEKETERVRNHLYHRKAWSSNEDPESSSRSSLESRDTHHDPIIHAQVANARVYQKQKQKWVKAPEPKESPKELAIGHIPQRKPRDLSSSSIRTPFEGVHKGRSNVSHPKPPLEAIQNTQTSPLMANRIRTNQ